MAPKKKQSIKRAPGAEPAYDETGGLTSEAAALLEQALVSFRPPPAFSAPADTAQRIRSLQDARDTADAILLESAWYGPVAKVHPRRATEIEDCRIFLARVQHGYPSLAFVAGGTPADGTCWLQECSPFTYGFMQFYLRNQWDSGPGYWLDDPQCYGALRAAMYETEDDPRYPSALRQRLDQALQASDVDASAVDTHSFMNEYSDDERSLIEMCVLRPLVMVIDRCFGELGGESANSPEENLERLGFTLGADIETGDAPSKGGGVLRSWRNELLGGDPQVRQRAFQALHLLQAT